MSRGGVTVNQLEVLYRTDLARFVRVAQAIVGDQALAHDAVHDAFVAAVRARASFRGETPLIGWVWRIVVNAATEIKRSRREELLAEDDVPVGVDALDPADTTVRRWIAALPERQRLAVFLRYFADLDYQAIATALDVEVGTVSATLAAAHATLRRALQGVKT
jgi:RNA polymerase sigma factor (sigma-70 family)